MINFLDCTLRDGGYYNDWDFDPVMAGKLIDALNEAGVQIIELGYKSIKASNRYFGLFKYCNEEYLNYLSRDDPSDYCFMVDIKEFIFDNKINKTELDKQILPVSESVFTWVRLASHFPTIEFIPEFINYFRELGYKICFNLMGGSLLSDAQIKRGGEVAENNNVDVFFLADSFGSFYPEDIRRLIRFIKNYYTGEIGIHTHDNQGLAYINTLVAIEEGVSFVDGTITGMGRGAGNLLTEQFLTGYSKKFAEGRYNSNALHSIIEDSILPMKSEFQWGFSSTYMYSGLNNIHPTYCQNLIESKRFTMVEIRKILGLIPVEFRSLFNSEVLESSVQSVLKSEFDQEKDTNIEFFQFDALSTNSVIIFAKGSNAKIHADNIISFSQKNRFPVIECNLTGFLPDDMPRFIAILNQFRLEQWLVNKKSNSKMSLISGFPFDSERNIGGHLPFTIDEFSVSGSSIAIPDYDVGFYALAIALKAGVKQIFLAGFDGFEDGPVNKSKEILFARVKKVADENGAVIMHITPTLYTVFEQGSLYEIRQAHL